MSSRPSKWRLPWGAARRTGKRSEPEHPGSTHLARFSCDVGASGRRARAEAGRPAARDRTGGPNGIRTRVWSRSFSNFLAANLNKTWRDQNTHEKFLQTPLPGVTGSKSWGVLWSDGNNRGPDGIPCAGVIGRASPIGGVPGVRVEAGHWCPVSPTRQCLDHVLVLSETHLRHPQLALGLTLTTPPRRRTINPSSSPSSTSDPTPGQGR